MLLKAPPVNRAKRVREAVLSLGTSEIKYLSGNQLVGIFCAITGPIIAGMGAVRGEAEIAVLGSILTGMGGYRLGKGKDYTG